MTKKDPTSQDFAEFRFTPELLSKPRKPGISAYMRIKNEEQFIALAILSHIDYFDEIIACYNDCTDNTEKILRELAAQYPQKIKIYHYLPKVHPLGSEGHQNAADDSVHGLANYYNYALSKTTYSVATKFDADHLAIACNLAPLIAAIRRDIAVGKKKVYLFSGINLMRGKGSDIGVAMRTPFAGNYDHMYHPVAVDSIYSNLDFCEGFNESYWRQLGNQYMGIMYFHLRSLKKGFGYSNFSAGESGEGSVISFDKFRSDAAKKKPRFRYRNKKFLRLKYALTGKHLELFKMRKYTLADNLKEIDFERDVIDRLDGLIAKREIATQDYEVAAKEFAEFRFTPELLSKPRKTGISAYMRIKNEERFVALAILSHIDYYDEIIACHNGCTDNTEKILHQLAAQYPQKIKIYHYLPKVHPIGSQAHRSTAADSVHSMANYSNYALSKTTYSVAVKLDADHLAIDCNLAPLIATIRRDLAAGKKKLYQFSGINLIRGKDSKIGVAEQRHFSGTDTIFYHPVESSAFFYNNDIYEVFSVTYGDVEVQYMGIMYFHLKYLKKDFGATNNPAEPNESHTKENVREWSAVSFDEFRSAAYYRKLFQQYTPYGYLWYFLYRNKKFRQLKYSLNGRYPRLENARIFSLLDNLKDIDFEREVIDRLDGL